MSRITRQHNDRLAQLGLGEGSVFRIVRRVNGMVQIRSRGNDLVIREELLQEMEYNDIL